MRVFVGPQRLWLGSIIACVLGSLLAPSPGLGQEGFEAGANHLAPNIGRNLLGVQTADLGGALEWSATAFITHADRPLVLEGHDGLVLPYTPSSPRVLGSQTTLHVLGSFAVTDWAEVGVDLPVILSQEGDRLSGTSDPNGVGGTAGVGDLRLVARLRFLDLVPSASVGRLRFGGSLDFGLPTGDRARLQGGGGQLTALALVEWQTSFGPRVAVNLGYGWRPETDYLGVKVRSAFAWGIGLEIPFLQYFRAIATARGGQSTEATLAAGASLYGIEVLLGVGLPLVSEPMAPDWRIFAGVGYRAVAATDGDRDGIPDESDECPNQAEDVDHFEDDDGCPDDDNDQDGVADADDGCPSIPEDTDGFEDDDGCPDEDDDGDGLADRVDRCPRVPEDRDGFEDGDGCPDEDNDQDGIADADDRCPLEPEDIDQHADEDGCPDLSHPMSISQVVYFEAGSAEIRGEDHYPLTRLAESLVTLPRGLHVWVEGYADDSGSDAANDRLSDRRAHAVIDFLVEHGAPRERMTARPYGERVAAYANDSEDDRRINRRVEFHVAPHTLEEEATAAEAPEEESP